MRKREGTLGLSSVMFGLRTIMFATSRATLLLDLWPIGKIHIFHLQKILWSYAIIKYYRASMQFSNMFLNSNLKFEKAKYKYTKKHKVDKLMKQHGIVPHQNKLEVYERININ